MTRDIWLVHSRSFDENVSNFLECFQKYINVHNLKRMHPKCYIMNNSSKIVASDHVNDLGHTH